MIKHYSFSAYWRKKDIDFLNGLGLDKTIVEGADGFGIEEGKTYEKIVEHYSRKNSIFRKTRPKGFSHTFPVVTFSKEELEGASYFALSFTGNPKTYPQPKNGNYRDVTFKSDNDECNNNRQQIAPFRIAKMKWKKNEVNFALHWEHDFMFFKKDFFIEVLQPLGLKYREVIVHGTGKVSGDTVQLDIPIAKSRLLIENTAYDIHGLEETCGQKQYAVQILGFFPPFKNQFDFLICKAQEDFFGGRKKIIVSKKFCDLLVKHKIIKFNTYNLIPMKKL